ncbi:MAG: hypothetical protein ACI4MH_05545 [Candidatus Coproplasma sp.]
MATIVIISVAALAALGLIVGLVKGLSKASCWGCTVIGTVILTRLCVRFVPDSTYFGEIPLNMSGVLSLVIALGILLALTLLCSRARRFINKAMAKRQKLSYYRQHDEREENEEKILVALDNNDKKTYRKLSKRKFRESRGAWGVVDRVLGGICVAANAVTAIVLVWSLAFVTVDMIVGIGAEANLDWVNSLSSLFAGTIDTAFWVNTCSKFALDVIVVCLMCLCIRTGYKGGILSWLGTVLVLALVVGAGFLSYVFAFNFPAYISLATDLTNGAFAGIVESMSGIFEAMSLDPIILAQITIMVVQFLLFLIPVIIAGVFIPRLIDKIRDSKVVAVVDGALGALVLFAVIFAVLMFVGAVVYQLNDVPALAVFNTYMKKSAVAKSLYSKNFLAEVEFIKNIPIRSWFGLS